MGAIVVTCGNLKCGRRHDEPIVKLVEREKFTCGACGEETRITPLAARSLSSHLLNRWPRRYTRILRGML